MPEPFVLRRQNDPPFGLQRAQGLRAGVGLTAPPFVVEVEPLAQILGQRSAPKPAAATSQQIGDLVRGVALAKPFFDEVFALHAPTIGARGLDAQEFCT